ncbi:MAG: hypothetical protein J6D34_11420 [Atopobiaceae bacterium]|nr:hypothetical protein [Atopobiaceae bacterium]
MLVALGVALPVVMRQRANEAALHAVPEHAEEATLLTAVPASSVCSNSLDVALDAYLAVLHEYALSRVHVVSCDVREPAEFGPWDAPEELDATEANDDGLLTKWSDGYYIAHDWSDYGLLISSMVPGDKVTVNGSVITVEGVFDYPREAYLDEIRVLTGYDAVVLQTCETGTDLNRIVYGNVR